LSDVVVVAGAVVVATGLVAAGDVVVPTGLVVAGDVVVATGLVVAGDVVVAVVAVPPPQAGSTVTAAIRQIITSQAFCFIVTLSLRVLVSK
jgi:hypothetical protein